MRLTAVVFLLILSGCATVQVPGYISKIGHPYERKIYGSFEKVASAFIYVLKKQGWTINSESDPALYERDDRYDNNGYQNLLIMTEARRMFLNLRSVRLNIFIHSFGNTCDVEIRYEAKGVGSYNKLVSGLLDSVEEEVNK